MARSHRLATVGLALLTTTSVVIGPAAAPAQAAATGVVSVYKTTKVRYKAATGKQNRIVITRAGNTITVDDVVAIKAGTGCKKVKGDKTRVRCTTAKAPTTIVVYSYDRNDSITNNTDVRMSADSGTGSDRLYGGSRGDSLFGGSGADRLYGRAGNDDLNGDDGNDFVDGGDGHDHVQDSGSKYSGNDVIRGGSGDDIIRGYAGNDRIHGDGGYDLLYGGQGSDRLDGGYGDDIVQGDDCDRGPAVGPCVAADILLGGPGTDTVDYVAKDKPLTIDLDGAGRDDGQAGEHDTVGADIEIIFGGLKNDRLTGNSADNLLAGGPGNDVVHGAAGNDRLEGMAGNDKLYGDAGDDVLLGNDEGANKADLLDGGTNTPTGDQCVAKTYDTKVGCER
jgi:serralysin